MTLNGRVPVAVVGAGKMGLHHARNYDELDRADLRAVVDPDRERAERVAARFGCSAFATLDDLLDAEPDVAAVSVAVPTNLHHEAASRLIAAGKHVLVEKPIAASVEEADDLVARARDARVVLAAGHVERFNPGDEVCSTAHKARHDDLYDFADVFSSAVAGARRGALGVARLPFVRTLGWTMVAATRKA